MPLPTDPMNVVVLCATRRGIRFLQLVSELLPAARLTVFSFREAEGEPRYFEEMRVMTLNAGGRFIEARSVDRPDLRDFWQAEPIDLVLAVSWRYLVPRATFERPTLGAYVFHDSLLPKSRGFSPTVWAIANGDTNSGVTLFAMTDDVDAGDIVDQQSVPIGATETIADVLERTTGAYLSLLRRNVRALAGGHPTLRPQDHAAATYCRRRTPEDNEIRWSRPAQEIHNLIRAVSPPYPGAYTTLGGCRVAVLRASVRPKAPPQAKPRPGRVIRVAGRRIEVETGDGNLLISTMRIGDGDPLPAGAIVQGAGTILGG